MARYSDINRADELKAAAAKLDIWRKLSRTDKKALYQTTMTANNSKRANVGRKIGFIQPFIPSTKVFFETKVLAPAPDVPLPSEQAVTGLINDLVSAIGARVIEAPPTTAATVIFPGRNVKFAKALLSEYGALKSGGAVSRITGLPYSYRENSTVSCSFGRATATETEPAARIAIRAAITASDTKVIRFRIQGDVRATTID